MMIWLTGLEGSFASFPFHSQPIASPDDFLLDDCHTTATASK
jgi:hypothetical protein